MTRYHFALAAIAFATTLAGASTIARAADPAYESDATRQQRMDSAYDSYRTTHDNTTGEGRFARAEDSVKRGVHRTGESIKHGAHRVGEAVGNGAHKTGEALRRTGEKIKDKTSPNN